MKTSTRVLEKNAFDLGLLDREHAEIRRRYVELENAILRGLGLPRILEAANSLVQMILLHFTHEERFLAALSLSNLQKRHRDANIEVTAQLFGIEAGLEQAKTAAVFQLLLLGRVWMKEHMHLESDQFECETEEVRPFSLRGALVDHRSAFAANTGGHAHPLHRLRHSHLRGQHSPQSAPELNG